MTSNQERTEPMTTDAVISVAICTSRRNVGGAVKKRAQDLALARGLEWVSSSARHRGQEEYRLGRGCARPRYRGRRVHGCFEWLDRAGGTGLLWS